MVRRAKSTLSHLIGASLILVSGACTDNPQAPLFPQDPTVRGAKARATDTPVVTSSDPSYGRQGETQKIVSVLGSGFAAGATVAFERAGVVQSSIVVHEAVVVTSARIDVRVSIALDADLTLYDIAVTNQNRKKGVGTEMFEVTTAISIGSLGGNTDAYAANDNLAGFRVAGVSGDGGSGARVFAWPDANGRMIDVGSGDARGIDKLGATIGGNSEGWGVTWTYAAAAWTRERLPVSYGASGSRVYQLASGPDGAALYAGGAEYHKVKNTTYDRPRLWKKVAGVWQVVVLPIPEPSSSAVAWVHGVNAAGQASGTYRNADLPRATFWNSDGVPTLLPNDGLPSGGVGGINAAGTVIAGASDQRAAYWTAVVNPDGARVWSGPFILPGDCARAVGISESGRIVGNHCASGGGSAVWNPPYDAGSLTYLGGMGDRNDEAAALGISPSGGLIVGTARPLGSPIRFGVIWEGPAL